MFPPVTSSSLLTDPIILSFFAVVILAAAIASVLFILRAVFHFKLKESKAFDQVVLQILVPKERKSEGQGGQVGQDDRLEQIREEIAITETFFSSLAGLRAQRGIMNWIRGRADNFSFEIVSHKNLINFYVAVPRKLQPFIEQQLHSQYPYAQIEEMTDYNIFTEKSSIVGACLSGRQKHVFPFKTYKKMDSDPLNVVLSVLGKNFTEESAMAVQFIVRSSNRKWRRKGVQIVRRVKKGEKFESVTRGNAFTRGLKNFFKEIGSLASSTKKTENKPEEKYQLSAMEEEMLKGIEEKLAKGGTDVTIRLLSASDNPETARLNLDNLINAFSQYNLYRYGNEFYASVPKKQSLLIRDFIYRSFNEKKKLILNTEEMAGFWHLPLHSTEAPNIKWLTSRRAPPPSNLPTAGLLLGYVDYRGSRTNVFMKEADRRRHLYIIGKSGGGKSVFIAGLAVQDIQNNKGVCVVDPHGDLVEYILQHIPKERADDVIIFNPSDMDRPVGL
ncbi:MAG: DUF87 domain-containing protein, partial [Candidatus Magasanikbacteria bacterium]|nr:DUF87 domain-containing protein [Candidatus Magasanikbacteria bacterium]